MNFPAIAQVDAYWEGLRGGRLMPARAEVDPRGLENALEYALMLEYVASGVARVRVAGQHLSNLLGMEVRGMPITAFFEPSSRARISEVLDQVTRGPKVAELQISSAGGLGRPAIRSRLFLAPLSGEDVGHPRILGALQSIGSIGRTPRRFSLDDVHLRRIVASAGQEVELRSADKIFDRPAASRPTEFAEPAATFQPADTAANSKERSYLRLVKSD